MDSQPQPNRLESISSAAAKLSISQQTLRKLIEDGSIPAHRIGKQFRVSLPDILSSTAIAGQQE